MTSPHCCSSGSCSGSGSVYHFPSAWGAPLYTVGWGSFSPCETKFGPHLPWKVGSFYGCDLRLMDFECRCYDHCQKRLEHKPTRVAVYIGADTCQVVCHWLIAVIIPPCCRCRPAAASTARSNSLILPPARFAPAKTRNMQ